MLRTWTDEDIFKETAVHGASVGLKTIPFKDSDIKPKPFITQIPLVEVFERLKRVKADHWQRDFCRRLQEATEKRDWAAVKAIIHAQAQMGKSVILAQAFAVWILGHDPLHRFALLTYNITRSQTHAEVVISLMNSLIYKDMFQSKDCHLPKVVSKGGFSTNGRKDLNDAQESFNPLGLLSGFVGNGADTVVIDDPYKSPEDVRSDTIRPKIERVWVDITLPRITQYVNVFGMFHRYSYDDFAGFLLATGGFDYWRYASQADGDYIDKNTGRVFSDPLNRKLGEYISERFPSSYYEDKKIYPQLWASQFQGRPAAETGAFFDVNQIHVLQGSKAIQKEAECIYWVRSWDNAATDEGGAFTVGSKVGITANHDILITDLVRKQVNTAKRYELQLKTARSDGKTIPATIPIDPGSGGTDTADTTVRKFADEGFKCIAERVSGTKEVRAQTLSEKVNAGKFYMLKAGWNKELTDEFEKFPLSIYKDIVDATADAERFLEKMHRKGLVINAFSETRNLVTWGKFAARFGKKIPCHWRVYVAVEYHRDASKASGAVILARAGENARLGETVFMVGCHKQFDADFSGITNWLEKMMSNVVAKNADGKTPEVSIMLNAEAENELPVLRRKLKLSVITYKGEKSEGLPETNWYLSPDTTRTNAFNLSEHATRFYWLVANAQKEKAVDEFGLLSARQEAATWTFNDKGEPVEFGSVVLNCTRMLLHHFRTHAAELTRSEQFFQFLEENHTNLMPEETGKLETLEAKVDAEMSRNILRSEWEKKTSRGDYIESEWNTFVREGGMNDEEQFELL